jgi:hypothetical protein
MNREMQETKVFSFEKNTNNLLATVPVQGDDITRHYECALRCCNNPVCTCGTVHLGFSPRGDHDRNHPISSYQVDIDVIRRKVGYKDEDKVSKENRRFTKLLLSSMNDADFQLLWKLYFGYKNELSEKAPIDSIEAVFDFQEVEQSGLMYAYKDVLPYGDTLFVNLKGEDCLIFDQYCLKPKCSCTEATLTFVTEDEDSDKTGKELFTIAVDYKKRGWSTVEDRAVPADVKAARSAMEDQIPDLYRKLFERHIKLKNIYAHCKKKYLKETPQWPKVGRNDPCPCGSGKKYKKCCM